MSRWADHFDRSSRDSEMNISSLVVDVRPEFLPSVLSAFEPWPGVEVQRASGPEGKLIVILEAETDKDTADTFSRINALEGVMSVAMVYHRIESEPEKEVFHGIHAA